MKCKISASFTLRFTRAEKQFPIGWDCHLDQLGLSSGPARTKNGGVDPRDTSWSSYKPELRVGLHHMSRSSHQRDLSISLRIAHERGHARRRCYWIEAVVQCILYYRGP